MAATYKLIDKATVTGSTQAQIEFANIPSTYTDLRLFVSGRSNRTVEAYDQFYLTFNNDTTSSNYRNRYATNNSGTAGSSTDQFYGIFRASVPAAGSTASNFGCAEFNIANYSATNFNKNVLSHSVMDDTSTNCFIIFGSHTWSNTNAITNIKITPEVAQWVQHTTAYLYGILKG